MGQKLTLGRLFMVICVSRELPEPWAPEVRHLHGHVRLDLDREVEVQLAVLRGQEAGGKEVVWSRCSLPSPPLPKSREREKQVEEGEDGCGLPPSKRGRELGWESPPPYIMNPPQGKLAPAEMACPNHGSTSGGAKMAYLGREKN